MNLLKQSTSATRLVGPVLDSTGAAYTGMAIGDFNITKNGTTAAMASAASVTHSHNGMYLLVFTTGNTDTLGALEVSCNKATYAMANHRYSVVPANIFDSVISGTDVLDVSVIQLLGTAWLTPAVAGTPDVNAKQIGGTGQTTGVDIASQVTILTYMDRPDGYGNVSSSTSTQTTLASGVGLVGTADYYKGDILQIVAGTGTGQSRVITTNSSGLVFTVDEAWATTPDNTSQVHIHPARAWVTNKTGYSLVSTGLDLVLIDSKTLPAALQIIAATTSGKLSGAGTTTETFVGLDGTTTRAVGTVDSSGNRSAVSYP